MAVLILGGHDDHHAVSVLEALDARGHDAELIDSRWFPSDLRVSFDPAAGGWHLGLPTGRTLGPGDVTAVYWRCYNGVGEPDLPDPEQGYIAANDARGLFESMLIQLPARWVNGWDGFRLHQTKPVPLAIVASLGVPTPATLLSNDPAAVRGFAAAHPASIFKPVQGGAHTRRVTPQHLSDANLRNLAIAPVTLQEEVPGTDVRAFVAGERVLACEVRTDAIDFRDAADAPVVAHELPAAVAEQSRRVARALHLLWTGIDYRRTPDGRYVFLEANPSPMFLGFEARCGLPLLDALIGLLTGEGR
ncbi:MAG: RimK-like protein [Gemmataceae bacterium]